MMKKQKLIVGQIGCGKFAEAQDFPNFKKHPQTELKWCCDLNLARAKEMGKKFGVRDVTADFMDVLNDPQVQMIKIATSHEVHLPIIEAAAAKGIHIFCEKPMAMEQEEAFKIIRIVRRSGIKLCVDFNRRMAPSLQALRAKWLEHSQNPEHQPWRYWEAQRPPMAEEETSHMMITVQDESSSYAVHHMDPLKGGGKIIGETVHWLDLACWFFAPQRPVEIQAWGSRRLSHGFNLKFSGGDSVTLVFHCSGTFDYPKEMYQITSNAALFRNQFFVKNEYYGIPGAKKEVFPMQHDCMKDEVPEDGIHAYMKKYLIRAKGIAGNSKKYEYTKPFIVDKGHYSMLCGFVDAILNDKPSPCDEMAGYMATYLAQLAIRSLDFKQTVPVPLEMITPVFI